MKLTKLPIFLILIFLNINLFSQRLNRFNIATPKDVMSIHKSIEEMEEVVLKTISMKRTLAEFYYNVGDYLNAEIYYFDVVSSPERMNIDLYNYASILMMNENYSESIYWMNEYAKLEKNDSRIKLFLKYPEYYETLLLDQGQFRIKNIESNTAHKEYGTAYNNDRVVFASTRSRIGFKKKIRKKISIVKLYSAKVTRGQFSNIRSFAGIFNKKYRDIHVAFNDKGTKAAYTRYNLKNVGRSGVRKLQIFFSDNKNGIVSDLVPCPFNSEVYSVGFVSFNKTGDEMYFTSDMPGGYGGTDIYRSFKNADGFWVEPVNLGKNINTEGNEMFPFIHDDGYLFFSSDGIPGIGGLDIFFSKLIGEEFSDPKNLGVPANSNRDDFAFIIDEKMRRGFFSSDREFGKGSDDIYSFRLLKPFTVDLLLKGKTIDTQGNYIPFANVGIYDDKGEIIKMVNSDNEGDFEFKVTQNESYRIEASKPKHRKDFSEIKIEQEEGVLYKDLVLQKLPDFVIKCRVRDKKDFSTIKGVKVIYEEIQSNNQAFDTTDNEGVLIIGLKEKKLNDSISYRITFEKEGYATRSIVYDKVLNTPGENKIDIQLKKIEIGEDLGKILEINPIYFDYAKSEIREDAAKELDKIVEIMNEYPNMVIELSSHTDCRGSSIYNLKLSDRRAKASAHYIKVRITNPTRIYGEGFGESQLINTCKCEGGKTSDCSEEEHQMNRRTEFKIVKI